MPHHHRNNQWDGRPKRSDEVETEYDEQALSSHSQGERTKRCVTREVGPSTPHESATTAETERFGQGESKEYQEAETSSEQYQSARSSSPNAGLEPLALNQLGHTAESLTESNITTAELNKARFDVSVTTEAGHTTEQLKEANVFAAESKPRPKPKPKPKPNSTVGHTTEQVKKAGLDAPSIKQVGHTTEQMEEANHTAAKLQGGGLGRSTPIRLTCGSEQRTATSSGQAAR